MIETPRLRIVPLSTEQFYLLLNDIGSLEKELRLSPSGYDLDQHTQQAMQGLYQKAIGHQESYLWYTNWQIILISENKSIGSACFMGKPNDNGEVEIGYGINAEYRNRGYMTEAAQSLCEWALNQAGVKSVIAETEKENLASHKVLQNGGMIKYKETEDAIWWKIEKQR